MENIIEHLLADDLSPLAGLRVKGKFPLKENLVNALIQYVLNKGKSSGSDPEGAPSTPTPPEAKEEPEEKSQGGDILERLAAMPAPSTLIKFVREASVEMREGQVVLHFDLAVEEEGEG